MGGPPPRTAISVQRATVAGLRFGLCCVPVWRSSDCRSDGPFAVRNHEAPLDWAARIGPPAMLAIIEHHGDLEGLEMAALVRAASHNSQEAEVALQARIDAALRASVDDAALPSRIGVFYWRNAALPGVPLLAPLAALAALSRRSGPLYLPNRPWRTPDCGRFRGTLAFPVEP